MKDGLPAWSRAALEQALAVGRAGPAEPAALAAELYSRWHAAIGPEAGSPPGAPPLGELLRRAHAGGGRWSPGWVVIGTSAAAVVTVVREGHVRQVAPPDYVNAVRAGVPPAPGEAVAIAERDDWLDPTGWWATAAAGAGFPSVPAVRAYWNAPLAAAAATVAAVTGALDETGLAWGLKAPPDAGGYDRRDAIVAVVARAEWPRAAPALAAAHRRLEGALRPEVPSLAKPLLPGLGVAEDPGAGRSFGELRCAELAEALLTLRGTGRLATADALDELVELLAAREIDPARPHLLDPGAGEDPYGL